MEREEVVRGGWELFLRATIWKQRTVHYSIKSWEYGRQYNLQDDDDWDSE